MSMTDSMSSSSQSDPSVEKALLSSLPLPSVSTATSTRTLSVQEACDDLGKCQDPVRILQRLKSLHKALIRSPVDAYNPSETFLAIQGATLRFVPPEQSVNTAVPCSEGAVDKLGSNCAPTVNSLQNEQEEAMADLLRETLDRTERIRNSGVSVAIEEEGEEDEEEEEKVDEEKEIDLKLVPAEMRWSIAEAALLATAALACVCVGPAWHTQLRLRRFQLAHRHKDGGGIDYTSIVSSLGGPASQLGNIRSISPAVETRNYTNLHGASYFNSTNPESVTAGGGPASVSGDTATGDKAIATVVEFPTIPEALPAALLRYAQAILRAVPPNETDNKVFEEDKEDVLSVHKPWIERITKVAIGQRLMVLALCCDIQTSSSTTGSNNHNIQQFAGAVVGITGTANTHDSVTSSTPQQQWTIPGAHEIVGRMLLFWLDICDRSLTSSNTSIKSTSVSFEGEEPLMVNQDNDRWHVLAVSRAVVDLIATGWRPLPGSGVGPKVVGQLLLIAKTGIEDLYSLSTTEKGEENENVAKVYEGTTSEQFLISLSSSAEALSALTALGTRSLIPQALVKSTVISVCRFRVMSGLIRESLAGTVQTWLQLSDSNRAEFLNQLASCLADTAEFLVVLCTNSYSSTTTLFTLLNTVATSNPRSEICALHMAGQQWSKGDKIACLESQTALRVLSAAFCRPSLPAGNYIRCHLAPFLGATRDLARSLHELLHQQMDQETMELQSALDLMSLALDVVITLGGFCKYLFEGNEDQMNAVEWDVFFLALEESLFPWFGYIGNEASLFHDASMVHFLEESHIEVQSVLLLVGALLDKFTRIEASPFRSIVDYPSQRRLFKFILTNIVPAIDPTDGELLGLSATRAWVKFGLFPYQLSGWKESTTEILEEIFCTFPESQSFVHSPHLRLVALKALITASRHGEATLGGPVGLKGNPISSMRLAGDNGDHHSQVREALIPVIKMTISQLTEPGVSLQNETAHYRDNRDQPFFSASQLSALNEYCLELAGSFVLDASIKLEYRKSLLTMIISLALPSKDELSSQRKASKEGARDSIFQARLQAIQELENCLVGAFSENLLDTWIVPPVIDSLSALLTNGIAKVDETRSISFAVQSVARSLSALLVLSRLRIGSHDSRVGIRSSECAEILLPDSIMKVVRRSRQHHDTGRNRSQKLSFLVKGSDELEESVFSERKSRTIAISFDKITDNILSVLEACRNERSGTDAELLEIQQCLSSLCFHTLTEFWLSGVSAGKDHVRQSFLHTCLHTTNAESINEALARRRSLGIFLQCIVAHPKVRCAGDLSTTQQNKHLQLAWELVMRSLSEAEHKASELNESIRSVVAVLPSFAKIKDASQFTSSLFEWIVDTLQEKISNSTASHFQSESEVWMRLFGLAHDILLQDLPAVMERDLFRIFEACCHVLSCQPKAHLYGSHLALRCAAIVIDTMPLGKIMQLQQLLRVFDTPSPQDTHATVGLVPVEEDGLSWSQTFPSHFMRHLLLERSRYSDNVPVTAHNTGAEGHCNYLEKLAIEWNCFESFEVELDIESKTRGCSTWFDGKSLLLSLRVGSSKSRYRGWVEVMVRTPTTRIRKVIRLFNKLSLKQPHRPLSLWSTEPLEGHTVSDTAASMLVSTKYNTESLVERYQKLTARFDEMVPTSQIESQPESFERMEAQIAQDETRFSSTERSKSESESKKEDETSHIRSWLCHTLKDDDSVEDVIAGLEKLGISHEEITEVSSTDCNTTSDKKSSLYDFFCRLEGGSRLDRSLSVLDRTIPCNTHKIALLYSGPKRVGLSGDTEAILLSNKLCSPAFHDFSERLGSMVVTRHLRFFSAGLDVSSYESDGHFTRAWVNRGQQRGLAASKTLVVYHIPSLMPEGLNQRKRHVGNDNVLIVFVDKGSTIATDVELSPAEYIDPIVSGHFNFVTIYVSLLSVSKLVRVTVRVREKIDGNLRSILLGFTGTSIVHFEDAADVVRSLAVRADLACRTIIDNLAPASNPHERYRMLQQMERYVEKPHIAKEAIPS